MNVFKFGGASVNCAEGVRNFVKIVQSYRKETIIVLSAMGKTTNALEQIALDFFHKKETIALHVDSLRTYHFDIIEELFPNKEDVVYEKVEHLFNELNAYLAKTPSLNYNYDYDQIVSFGELLSTTIVSEFLRLSGTKNKWIDIRTCLKTDDTFREGKVDWKLSSKLIAKTFNFNNTFVYITQGFLGGTTTNLTTTLGREGSDYTAAVISNILEAEDVTIWKDVPGIMNADPKWLPDAEKIDRISYREAIELAFYGGKVIHPKTIQPLQQKKIPLQVRSFLFTTDAGTVISKASDATRGTCPIFIRKQNQVLITIRPNDFSFIVEKNMSRIFDIFSKNRIKVNVIQNSAISFSVCIDHPEECLQGLIEELSEKFLVKYNQGVELITIRHQNKEAVERMTLDREILLEQRSRDTAQFVLL